MSRPTTLNMLQLTRLANLADIERKLLPDADERSELWTTSEAGMDVIRNSIRKHALAIVEGTYHE